MNGSRSISHFAFHIPLKLGKQTLLVNFFQINNGGYEIGLGCVTLNKMVPYTISLDMMVLNIHKEREIIIRISLYLKS